MLPTLPAVLDLQRTALPATYAGRVQRLRHGSEHGRAWRFAHHKRWYYASAASATHYLGVGIVHLGYAGRAFVSVCERGSQSFVVQETALMLPGPWFRFARFDDGACDLALHSPKLSVAMSRTAGGSVTVSARGRELGLRLFLAADEAHPFVAAAALRGGATSVTEKTLGMRAAGELIGRGAARLEGLGGLDVTDGLLPRHTVWRWASFNHPGASLNLVQDWMGKSECVALVGGALVPLQEASIDYDPLAPSRPWHISTLCGNVSLTFVPLAVHRQKDNLGLVRADFIQPCGLFSGTVCGQKVIDALGVAEAQNTIW